MITATDKTATMIAAQLTEPTGVHMLDSGGAYGRGWQQLAGMTAENFAALPAVTVDEYGGLTVSLFHVLAAHFEHTYRAADLTAEFRAYVAATPDGDAYYNSASSVEEWLEGIGIDHYTADNTYNYDTYLDGVVQYVAFFLAGDQYVALSTHNGADVRGGYSDYVIYRACECWLYAATTAAFECRMCNTYFDADTHEVRDSDGCDYPDGIGPRGECPKCRWPELTGGSVGVCWE